MDMKHWRYILLCLFAAALCCCSDENDIDGLEKVPKEGILIRLTNGALTPTKTDLSSSANLHHIQAVHAFLYQGDTTDMANASFVLSENLNWNPKDSLGYGVDAVQIKEYLLQNTLNLPSGNYTLLCVGLDDRSGDTYNLPEALIDKPLSEAKAILANTKTQDDIAHSELFAGWETFAYKRGALSRVEVEMRRRVAGVLCYLKDIPFILTEGSQTYRVTRVQLRLSSEQNRAVSLLRPKTQGADDFGENPLAASDTILSSVDLVEANYSKQTDKNLYAIPVPANEQTQRLPNTILMGAYLLPVKNDGAGTTSMLTVEVLGKAIISGTDTPAADAEEVLVKSFPAVQEEAADPSDRLRYPIRPNMIYHIGQKSSDTTSDGDYPESLAGTKLNLTVKPWTRDTVDVNFPSIAVNSSMEFENGYADSYIFDCISYEEKLIVYPSLLNEPWKLTVVAVDENGKELTGDEFAKGVYIRSREPNADGEYTYSKEYMAEGDEVRKPTAVTIFIEDYANPNVDYNTTSIADDYRRYQLRLEKRKQGIEMELLQTIPVNQYNAIIVDVKQGLTGTQKRGFRRYDLETYRTRQGGIEELNPVLIEPGGGKNPGKTNDGSGIYMAWGYWSTASTSIFSDYLIHDDEGWLNYTKAKEQKPLSEAFSGSVIERAYDPIYNIQNGQRSEWASGWFLPSSNELKAFFELLKDQNAISDANIKNSSGDKYWTSCPYLTTLADIVYYKNGSKGLEVKLDHTSRTDQCWSRQARNIVE